MVVSPAPSHINPALGSFSSLPRPLGDTGNINNIKGRWTKGSESSLLFLIISILTECQGPSTETNSEDLSLQLCVSRVSGQDFQIGPDFSCLPAFLQFLRPISTRNTVSILKILWGFSGGPGVKHLSATLGHMGSIPGLGRSHILRSS